MGMGFDPNWLRQVSPASQNHFNHCYDVPTKIDFYWRTDAMLAVCPSCHHQIPMIHVATTELYVGTGSTRTSHIYGKVDASGRPYCLGICLIVLCRILFRCRFVFLYF